MNINLTRTDFREDGIFGFISDEKFNFLFVTLEHSYSNIPKLPPGEYICKRGIHRLHDLVDFEAFEVMDVPGHTGILFHVGNYNENSDGCILLGMGLGYKSNGIGRMIMDSGKAFNKFMILQKDCDEFNLNVEA